MMNGSTKRGQTVRCGRKINTRGPCNSHYKQIADLKIEKTSLLAVNTTLEATLRRQAQRIVELEKRLEMYVLVF